MTGSQETATSDDTVTVMIGSLENMTGLINPGIVDPLVSNGSIGLDAMDYIMSSLTFSGSGDVPQFAQLWAGTGSGTQEGTATFGTVPSTVTLQNTTSAPIIVPVEGATFSTSSGQQFMAVGDTFNGAWTKGAVANSLGGYLIDPGQSVTIPVEATQFGTGDIVAANAINQSSIAGLTVTASAAGDFSSQFGQSFSNPSQNNQGGFFSSAYGEYGTVFTSQGLAPAEAHVNIDESHEMTANDLAAWKGYVDNARSVGILNVAPIYSDNDDTADLTQPFATSAWYTNVRAAALYGGGLAFDLPPFYWELRTWDAYRQNIIEQIRWCHDNGLRSSLLLGSQEPNSGFDTQYAAQTQQLLNDLKAADALPSQIVVENYNSPAGGSYYDSNLADLNSMNAVALQAAKFGTGAPTPSEDGLEVKGTSAAQTTLIMTGVHPTLDYTPASTFSPYSIAAIRGEDPSKLLTLTVRDTAGLMSLSDSVGNASAGPGGTLTFSGTAAQATNFIDSLGASAASGASGTAELTLTLTDYLGEQTAGVTAVSIGHLHPQLTSISADPSNSGTLRPGATVTYTVTTNELVSVSGSPSLLLSNTRVATYAGMDAKGDLLFDYTVANGDDAAYLRVRALQINGATIVDGNGLSIDPDQFGNAAGYENSLVVDTKNLIASNYSEIGSTPVLGAGSSIDFLVAANAPLTSVTGGAPTITLSDGATVAYSGLSTDGRLSFVYQIPTGGIYSGLAISGLDMNGATATDAAGEPLIPFGVPTLQGNAASYDTTGPLTPPDQVTFALSEDAAGGDAVALFYVDGQQVGGPVTVTASHAAEQVQDVTFNGSFGGGGVQNASVVFENATSGRNLYLNGLTFDGQTQNQTATLTSSTTATVPIVAAPLDLLQLQVSEDEAAGDALFTVAVDGNTLPGTFTTTASHAAGQWQTIDVYGAFGQGAHDVTVTFLNQYFGERHLYVRQAGIDGQTTTVNQELMGTGWQATASVPAAPDQLTLDVAEDAWQGDAQFYVTVDGKQIGGLQTVTASHSVGAVQAITLNGSFGAGSHAFGVTFVNAAGPGQQARNLYLEGAAFDGGSIAVNHEMTADGIFTLGVDYAPPQFTKIQEVATNSGTLRSGAFVAYDVATNQAVTVDGFPTLLLSNGHVAQYWGQDSSGNLLFGYSVQTGDDTRSLQVSALQTNGATIMDAAGYEISPNQLAQAVGFADSFVVDTKNLIVSGYNEIPSAGGSLGAGGTINFVVSASQALTSVSGGTPTLSLSDGGIAAYSGLTSNGEMSFAYTVPTGGKASDLTVTALNLNGAAATDSAGEPVIPFGAPPLDGAPVSYDATGPLTPPDQVTFALSESGSGSDAIALLYVNGKQVGGPVTVTASRANGQVQDFTVTGNFGGGGVQNAGVFFENAASGRNLYLNGLTFDGQTQNQTATLTSNTTATVPIVSAPLDLLQLQVSEDEAAGDALFTVAVDGNALPGTFTTTASHAAGRWQTIDVYGAFGQGAHDVTVTFLNQYFGQRHLYVGQVGIDGETASVNQELLGTGWQATASVPAAPDQLTLDVAEDAWQGDAQFYLTVDGKQVGGLQTVTASHSAGAVQAVTLNGSFGVGLHNVGMTFVNAASGGSAQAQRNLYIEGATFDGGNVSVQQEIAADGTFNFGVDYAPPQFTTISEMATSTGNLRPGAFVAYVLGVNQKVSVSGFPTLQLSNGRAAQYWGQDSSGNLLFGYSVQSGDDTSSLQVSALQVNGATITDASGYAVNPSQLAQVPGFSNSFVVDTKNLILSGYSEMASGGLGSGGGVEFLVSASQPLTTVAGGTPTLSLSDGGTATYTGLTSGGQMAFLYTYPTGAKATNLTATNISMNGASATDAAGEPVVPFGAPPLQGGPLSYDATGPLTPPDHVTFALSEDATGGDAVALLYVNGQQVGGPVTVTASHAAGEVQDVTVSGNFGGGGVQKASIVFENAASGRNLYLNGLTFDGQTQNQTATLTSNTTATVPIVAAPLDLLQLQVSEDAAAGDALFTVAVDGKTLPGTFTTTASHAAGQWQTIDVYGAFGQGAHDATITFLNQYFGQRHLYVGQVGIDGETASVNQELMGTGWQATASVPAAPDQLTLDVAEDASQGDAQFYVTVDGKQIGGLQTVTASHAAGQTGAITLGGNFGGGQHTVGMTFLNATGSGQATRNLYLEGASLDGTAVSVQHMFPTDGSFSFQATAAKAANASLVVDPVHVATAATVAAALQQPMHAAGLSAVFVTNHT